MQGILYLDNAPKLYEAIPTAIAKMNANTEHINILGSPKDSLK